MLVKDYFMEAPFDLKIEEQTPYKYYDSWKTNKGISLWTVISGLRLQKLLLIFIKHVCMTTVMVGLQ